MEDDHFVEFSSIFIVKRLVSINCDITDMINVTAVWRRPVPPTPFALSYTPFYVIKKKSMSPFILRESRYVAAQCNLERERDAL